MQVLVSLIPRMNYLLHFRYALAVLEACACTCTHVFTRLDHIHIRSHVCEISAYMSSRTRLYSCSHVHSPLAHTQHALAST